MKNTEYALALAGVLLAAPCFAESVKLAEKTVYQYGGPETRTRCVSTVRMKGVPSCHFEGLNLKCDDTWIETCTGYATDFQQHAYNVVMFGPSDLNKDQLETIKNSCFASAVAVEFNGFAFTVDNVAQALTSHRPAMEGTFQLCIKTTEGLGQLVEKDFRLETNRSDFW